MLYWVSPIPEVNSDTKFLLIQIFYFKSEVAHGISRVLYVLLKNGKQQAFSDIEIISNWAYITKVLILMENVLCTASATRKK